MLPPDLAVSPLVIGIHSIAQDNIFFVVEEGNAHDGEFQKALAMIHAAAEAGADAIEFQLAHADEFYVAADPGCERYRKREYSPSQYRELLQTARGLGLEFIATPFSRGMVDLFAAEGCSAFTINASDLNNPDILDPVAESGRPFFLALPLATRQEVDWAVQRVVRKGATAFGLLVGQHPMGGTGSGVPIENTQLGAMQALRTEYGVSVGFIDHTPLSFMPAIAAAAGAQVITKHLALSRAEKGPDWWICLEPAEMKEAIALARKARESVAISEKTVLAEEMDDRPAMRRSVVAGRDLPEGHVIALGDLSYKRPGGGIAPSERNLLVSRRLLRAKKRDEKIFVEDMESSR